MAKESNDKFSDQETKQRMEAALRGARISGHKPMSDIPKSKPSKVSTKPTKARKTK